MSIRLIRQDSQTPNVTNHDDARMVRYAYGGFDGFVKDRGSEIDYAIDGTSFVVQSGVLVLQGWEVEIDANGAAISVPPNVSTTQYFSVYLEVNCGTDTAAIKSTYRSGTYPDIPASDDLTANTVGTARLLLYRFTATNGVISNVKKAVRGIEYGQKLKEGIENGTIIAQKAANAENSQKINGINLVTDDNGKLKIGEIIIPQKKLLWSGNIECSSRDNPVNISLNDVATPGRYIIEYTDTFYNGSNSTRKFVSSGCRDYDTGMLPVDFEPLSTAGKYTNEAKYYVRSTIPYLLLNISSRDAQWGGVYYSEMETDNTITVSFHRSMITKIYKIIE